MKKVLLLSILVLLLILIWLRFSQNSKNYLYRGFLQTPVYLEDSNSIAFIDCDQECAFHIYNLSSESTTLTIENVDNAGLEYYSPNSFFIIGKNNGHKLIGFSLQKQEEFEIDLTLEGLAQSLASHKNLFKEEFVYSLNPFDKDEFISPQMFCLKSSGTVNIPNKLSKDIIFVRKVKQLGLAGIEVKYFLQVDGQEILLRKRDGVCLIAPDSGLPNLYIVDSDGIEKITIK